MPDFKLIENSYKIRRALIIISIILVILLGSLVVERYGIARDNDVGAASTSASSTHIALSSSSSKYYAGSDKVSSNISQNNSYTTTDAANKIRRHGDIDQDAVDKALSTIRGCLSENVNSRDCLGAYIEICEITYSVCATAEIKAWNIMSDDYISTIQSANVPQDILRSTQNSWEKYADNECLFVAAFWANNASMRNTETVRCELTMSAERAILLKAHVANLNQR